MNKTIPNWEYTIILFYTYTHINNPEELMHQQRELCERLGLLGRTIIAHEGINSTLEGTTKAIKAYIATMEQDETFADIDWKISKGTGTAFPRLSIKVRDEIVSLQLDANEDIDPNTITGEYLEAQALHQWLTQKKEVVIIDMRNDYEFAVGHFENSVLPNLHNFRDLPTVLPDLEQYKDKTIVTVCTGGIRCEKASGYLKSKGFNNVYQLKNGIVTYMEKYPNQHFKGKLYVFDGRTVMGFETDSPEHEIIGTCHHCGIACDEYGDCANLQCHVHIVCCTNCRENNQVFCSVSCKEKVLTKSTV